MCGICGQVNHNPSQPVNRPVLEQMNAVIRHRGPDSDGFYVHGNVGLAMRRLAIVDLHTGDQPMSNEACAAQWGGGVSWIVFNGEIFNYPELRPELEQRGHHFCTNADTEVILHLYEEYGPDCVQHLNGQFAFAIWDTRKRRLLLARDRLGQKPLYYTEQDGAFLFGSEIKSLLQYPGVARQPNLEGIHHYLTLQYIPAPMTGFQGIHKLPPAHCLILEPGRPPQIERYWDLPYEPKWDLPEAEIRQQLRETITAAVRRRLMSDVPLGAHLSGGIDSSIIVGLMAEMMNQPVKTFSIGFKESEFNELAYARQIAQKFGTDHHEFILEPDALDILPRLVEHFDEPFADPAALPTWYLAQMTRQHVTVALNGDGGDEAFAGYQRYFGDVYVDIYRMIPAPLRAHVFDRLIYALPVQADRPMERSYAMALRGLARGANVSHAASKVRWSTHFSHAEKWALYNGDVRGALRGPTSADLLEADFRRAQAAHRIDRTLYTDIHNYLPGALLPKVDRTTMAHSLEARSPFLDHTVMELSARLPVRWKVRGRRTKHILRDLFADLLPLEIEQRGKVGFGVPLGMWFKGPLRDPAHDLLLGSDARALGYFRREAVARLLDENQQGQADHGKRIWTLLNLELWLRRYMG